MLKKFLLAIFILYSYFAQAQRFSAGYHHSIYLCSDSTVRACGNNTSGGLGNGSYTDSNIPIQVSGLTQVIAVSAGNGWSMALKANGTVWAWGNNGFGQLGNGTTTNSNIPVQITSLSNIQKISCGTTHGMALSSSGVVYTWGYNVNGQLGNGNTIQSNTPIALTTITNVIGISAGTWHSLALKNDGTVWAWGQAYANSLTVDNSLPAQVVGLTNMTDISASQNFSMALKNDGTVWTWGHNVFGQLGNGTTNANEIPNAVPGLTGIQKISHGCYSVHVMAINAFGVAKAWGHNGYGQFANNTTINSYVPLQIPQLDSNTTIQEIAVGNVHTIFATNTGSIKVAGWNLSGQLGNASTVDSYIPVSPLNLCAVATSVNTKQTADGIISVYPNPINNIVYIEVNTAISSAQITDYTGKTVKKLNLKAGVNTVDVSTLHEGIYLVTLVDNFGKKSSVKVTK